MKRVLGHGLLGLLAFLLFLVLLAPASLVADRIGERLPGFSAQTAEGTVTEAPCATCAGAASESNG